MDNKEKTGARPASGGDTVTAPKGVAKAVAMSSLQTAMPPEVLAQSIAQERSTLPDSARRFLGSYLIANTGHALNEQCFRHVHTFKPVTLTFANLRANSKAFVTLHDDQQAIWSEGGGSDRLVGLSLSSRADPVLYLSDFLVNAREMYLQTYKDVKEIQVALYVRTGQSSVRGRADLPPNANVTLQSGDDRTTVIGFSSFALTLG
jgi:hypothetical protein